MQILKANPEDWELFWPTFQAIVAAEDTYGYDPAWTKEQSFQYWFGPNQKVFFARDVEGNLLGSFYIKPNAYGPASHIANAGFMVSPKAQGKGAGRAMGEAALQLARDFGYRAMQFNLVVSSNHNAVKLWKSLGFDVIGTVPDGFKHPSLGFVDTYVMYRLL